MATYRVELINKETSTTYTHLVEANSISEAGITAEMSHYDVHRVNEDSIVPPVEVLSVTLETDK